MQDEAHFIVQPRDLSEHPACGYEACIPTLDYEVKVLVSAWMVRDGFSAR